MAAVYGVAHSRTRMTRLSSSSSSIAKRVYGVLSQQHFTLWGRRATQSLAGKRENVTEIGKVRWHFPSDELSRSHCHPWVKKSASPCCPSQKGNSEPTSFKERSSTGQVGGRRKRGARGGGGGGGSQGPPRPAVARQPAPEVAGGASAAAPGAVKDGGGRQRRGGRGGAEGGGAAAPKRAGLAGAAGDAAGECVGPFRSRSSFLRPARGPNSDSVGLPRAARRAGASGERSVGAPRSQVSRRRFPSTPLAV